MYGLSMPGVTGGGLCLFAPSTRATDNEPSLQPACTLVQYLSGSVDTPPHRYGMARASRRDVRFSADRIRQGGNATVETLQKCSEGDVELDAKRYAA